MELLPKIILIVIQLSAKINFIRVKMNYFIIQLFTNNYPFTRDSYSNMDHIVTNNFQDIITV